MSGGWVTSRRRSRAGVSPVRTPTLRHVGEGLARPLGRVLDAGQRGPKVLLHVDRERPQG